MFDISVNIKDPKKADNILKSSWEVQSFNTSFIIFQLLEIHDDSNLSFIKKLKRRKKYSYHYS